ncbi:ExbD/TolR family protein [Actibacterium lipolyticum]|uniref:Biopolymer transport protein ExbD/TolR n=1 Tax=Actibacterium lipolyticum TaxID=1524263 RepID=A0A238KFX9_9RHOB|nr:biopolymer transporter ExbD [Actibacterium lipolyticum]SMX41537.1 Biopolymer transport protein ExbD/TolR [Actibacterium lipolyticum]
MDFAPPARRPQGESIIPMINVVFLLLIFFLMTSAIAPPEPVDVTPPEAASETQADGMFRLFLDADGALAFQETQGADPALAALGAARDAYCAQNGCDAGANAPQLLVRADQSVPAAELAKLLPRLAALGFSNAQLVTALP